MPTRVAAGYMFASGAAALIYEVLWIRDLGYVFGGSAPALSAVVGAFLSGLALGAWWSGRRVRPGPGLLRAYAWLEGAIALAAPLVPWLVLGADHVVLDPLWPTLEGAGLANAARFAVAFLLMLPATVCMGATLPVLCAAAVSEREASGALIGRLYGWNTLGGVVGCLLAGFVLVEHVGLWKSRLVAAAINLTLALCAWRRSRAAAATVVSAVTRQNDLPRQLAAVAATDATERLPRGWWSIALVTSSGLSIVLEFCWARLVALCVGGTAYAFSIVLAVYLLGLGAGALVAAAAARRRWPPVRLLAATQIALALLLLGMHAGVDDLVARIGLELFDAATGAETSPLLLRGGLGLLLCSVVVFVPALLLGVAFPLLSDLAVTRRDEIGAGVGAAYLLSTAGGVVASLAASFFLLPRFGIETTSAAAAAVAGALGTALLLQPRRNGATLAAAAAAAAATVLLLGFDLTAGRWDAKAVYGGLGLYGPRALAADRMLLDVSDGAACSVAVFEQRGERTLSVNGKVDASTRGDMGTQLLLAWLPQLFRDEPKEVFVLGWGAGVTAAAALRYGSRVRCAEIEEGVVAASEYFVEANQRAHADPRVELVVDDGRSLLRRGRRRFDVITTEPSNPWLAGMASLFTVEFYALCRARMTEGGVLCQWVQLYWSSPADYQAIFATLGSVFPHVAIWRTTSGDTLMLGSERELRFDAALCARRAAEKPWLAPDLAASSTTRTASGPLAAQLARMVLLEGADARALADAPVPLIRDDVPFLEFSAARRMQANSAGAILEALYAWRRTPLYAAEGLAAELPAGAMALLERDMAVEAFKNGAPELAEPLLLAAQRRAPTLEQLPFWLWLSARKRGDLPVAAQRLQALESSAPALLMQVVEEHLRERELPAARAALDRLEQRLGATPGTEFQRGRLLELEGQPADAVARYERALRLDNQYEPAREALKRMRDAVR